MGKKDEDISDLLGESKKDKAKKDKPKADKKAAKVPAAKTKAAPTAKTKAKAKTEKKAKEPITFKDGEREKIIASIGKAVKGKMTSRELNEKLGIDSRKLRACLYSAQRQGVVKLAEGESRVSGMMVSPGKK